MRVCVVFDAGQQQAGHTNHRKFHTGLSFRVTLVEQDVGWRLVVQIDGTCSQDHTSPWGVIQVAPMAAGCTT